MSWVEGNSTALPWLNSTDEATRVSQRHYSYILITEGNQLVGIFTNRDVVRLTATRRTLVGITIAEVMTRSLVVLKDTEYETIFSVLSLLKKHQIRHLPVVDRQGQLVGMVTNETLHQALQPSNYLKLRSVAEVMKTPVIYASPEISVLKVAQIMAEHQVSCVVICQPSAVNSQWLREQQISTDDGLLKPLGIISERDIAQYQLQNLDLERLPAAEVMSAPLFSLSPDDSLLVAHQTMQHLRVRRLVVTGREGELLGIITQTNLLQILDPIELYGVVEVLSHNVELKQANEQLQAEISARQHFEEELRQSEEKFRQLAENINAVFWMSNPVTQEMLYISPAYETIWGCSCGSLYEQPRSWMKAIHPDDLERVLNTLEERNCLGYPNNFVQEYRIVKPNGEIRYINNRSFSLRKASGEVYRLLGIAEDITDRKLAEIALQNLNQELEFRVKQRTAELQQAHEQLQAEYKERIQAEAALKESEERFRTIFEEAPIGMNICDLDGRFIQINQKLCEILGYTQAELQKLTFKKLTYSEDLKANAKYVRSLLANEISAFSLEKRYIHKKGHRIWAKARVSLWRDASGEPKYFIAAVEDITDRKQIELELKASQQKYKTLFDILPIGVCITDARGNLVEANPASEQILGLSVAEQIRLTCQDPQWPILRSDGTPMATSELAIIKALIQQKTVKNQEVGIVKTPQEITWLSVNAAPIPLNNYGVAIAYVDITERKKVEQIKDEFLAIASHELRTPLTGLRGALGLLATGQLGTLTEPGQRLLEFALLDTQRLVRLVNDILDLKRFKFGKKVINPQVCQTAKLIEQATSIMQPIADEAGVTIAVGTVTGVVWADGDRIIQVLTNLLSNAIKFSSRGSTIWLSTKPKDDWVVFQIKDQGRGIPPDKLDIIFEPFGQVDASDSRASRGTGLGLPICRSIVQQHQGRLWVDSTPGIGSTFYFTLPLPSKNTRSEVTDLTILMNQTMNHDYQKHSDY